MISDPGGEPQPSIRMEGMTKVFSHHVAANDGVDYAAFPGEIHGLLGENGAGKTTLMKILYGLYQPDEGRIFIRGEPEVIASPFRAIRLGIGMVHQHFMLVQPLRVVENILLAEQRNKKFILDLNVAAERVKGISEEYRLLVDPWARIWQLSVGEQQRVEILNALYYGADILILDEPTSVLTPQESDELGRALRLMADSGKTVIFISHKLDEVIKFTDRVTVLRDGRVVRTQPTGETTKADLARMMVGREVLFDFPKTSKPPGEPVCRVRGLGAMGDRGLPALKGVTFDVHRGEILGMAGVDGNGQKELTETLTGLRPSTSGEIRIMGDAAGLNRPKDFINAGVAHIPQDRRNMGLATTLPLWQNAILKNFDRPPVSIGGLLRFSAIRSFLGRIMEEFRIQASKRKTVLARQLSGGNQQRLVLGREFSMNPELLVANQPTQGLDVGATEYVREKLLEQRKQGMAILLISTDLEEILQLSDRVAILYEGEIMDIIPAEKVEVETLGLLMAGSRPAKMNGNG